MKRSHFIFWGGSALAVALAIVYNMAEERLNASISLPSKRPISEQAHMAPVRSVLSLVLGALAEEKPVVGDPSCEVAIEALQSATPPAYLHGALSHTWNMSNMLLKVFPSGPENALCHFNKSMGMNPDLNALPQTVEKIYGDYSVKLVVEAPQAAWAVAAGYSAKGTVTIDSTTYMVLYWGGSQESSKGFMIEGPDGFDSSEQSKRATYVSWDRTSGSQSVKVFAFKSSGNGLSADIAANGERLGILHGEATYDTATNAFTADVLTMEVRPEASNVTKCYKLASSGTLGDGGFNGGGMIRTAKESAAIALTSTAKDDTGMSGIYVQDSISTPNVCQSNPSESCRSLDSTELDALASFQYSCKDLNDSAGANGIFENSTVKFDTCPAVVFEGAASCS